MANVMQIGLGSNYITNSNMTEGGASRTLSLDKVQSPIWTDFNYSFCTFVNDQSDIRYGFFREHSNIFSVDTPIVLYIEPIGSYFLRGYDDLGKPIWLYNNYTVNIIINDGQGKQIASTKYTSPTLASSHKVAEQFFTVNIPSELMLHEGKYFIRYFVTDNISGKTFEIDKTIVINGKAVKPGIDASSSSISLGVGISGTTDLNQIPA